jgi:hypothetical protein
MHNVTFYINQDVSIVPILDLEHIANQRIRSKALAEIVLCLLEHSFILAKLARKVVNQLGLSSKLSFN